MRHFLLDLDKIQSDLCYSDPYQLIYIDFPNWHVSICRQEDWITCESSEQVIEGEYKKRKAKEAAQKATLAKAVERKAKVTKTKAATGRNA